MSKRRKNSYTIIISFNSKCHATYLSHQSLPYPQSKSNYDLATISSDKIVIEADRVSKVQLEGIFKNHSSSLYRQITKCIVYYYCCVRKPFQIESIEVKRNHSSPVEEITLRSNDLKQVVSEGTNLDSLSKIDLESLKVVFEESSKGHGYLYGLSYLIKSFESESQHARFENEWKSFNAIYKAISGKTTDFDSHVFLRRHMDNHHHCYPLIKSAVSKLKAPEVRNKIRLIRFIHNDFATEEKTQAFSDFVRRNQDGRLLSIIKDSLGVREAYLKNRRLYKSTVDHIERYKDNINDIHLAATLCIKYAYFVRNKIVHAETIDSGFRLIPLNKESSEVEWVSDLLYLLISDLVNCHNEF